jgi:hypothetical protein
MDGRGGRVGPWRSSIAPLSSTITATWRSGPMSIPTNLTSFHLLVLIVGDLGAAVHAHACAYDDAGAPQDTLRALENPAEGANLWRRSLRLNAAGVTLLDECARRKQADGQDISVSDPVGLARRTCASGTRRGGKGGIVEAADQRASNCAHGRASRFSAPAEAI